MVLKKIIKIKNIGKFVDSSSEGNTELKRINLIYGTNGVGKTTISWILRSLKSNRSDLIMGRKSLGQTGNPEVSLRLSSMNANFNQSGWSNTETNIEVFDSKFVNDNIFSGHAIEHNHKKNLFNVVIGENGVKLSKELIEIDDNIKDKTKEINVKNKEIKAITPEDLSVEKFIVLGKDDGVDSKIEKLSKKIIALSSKDFICSKQGLEELSISEKLLDGGDNLFNRLESVLSQTIDDISDSAETEIKKHMALNMLAGDEAWLNKGLQQITGESKCPFCAQEIRSVELIEHYKGYFKDSYKELIKSISDLQKDLESQSSIQLSSKVSATVERNLLCIDYWNSYIEINENKPSLDLLNIKELVEVMKKLLKTKDLKPLEIVNEDKEYNSLKSTFDQFLENVELYNQWAVDINEKIQKYKESISEGDGSSLIKEKSALEAAKLRHSSKVNTLCIGLNDLKAEKKQLEDDKKAKKDELEEYSKTMPQKFEEKINTLLEKFGATFQISKKQAGFPGGKPSSSYKISINGVDVELGDSSSGINQPCLKNTLSEGDKSTLAFSFFLTKLEFDETLNNKLLVIDDPMSSLDPSRKMATKHQILKLAEKAKQVIVLSHDPFFLKMLWDSCNKSITNTLKVFRKSTQSAIGEWSIDDDVKGSYFKDYSTLIEYLKDSSDKDGKGVARCIRPLLEGNMRVRFPSHIKSHEWLGDFIGKIRIANTGDELEKLKPHLEELSDINDYSKKFHHEQNPDAGNETVDDTELCSYIKRTFNVMKGVMYDA
jgi:wobble nucleotide-excising tRNase